MSKFHPTVICGLITNIRADFRGEPTEISSRRVFHTRIPVPLQNAWHGYIFISPLSHSSLVPFALSTQKRYSCGAVEKAQIQFYKCQDLIGDNAKIMKNWKPREKLGGSCTRDAIFHPDKHPDWSLSLLISASLPLSFAFSPKHWGSEGCAKREEKNERREEGKKDDTRINSRPTTICHVAQPAISSWGARFTH